MADASRSDELRDRLKKLGQRRKRLKADEEALTRDVQEALDESFGQVSVAEASRLLGIHRTTVYRVYEPHEHGRAA